MSSTNVTYNFNQQNPNFWQSFGLGALGMLTGGGYGGGYGMGMGSTYGLGGFGMGGSIFNMGCCGGGYYNFDYSNSYVGAQCGLAAVNTLFNGLGGYLKTRNEEKAKAAKTEETASNNVDTLKDEISDLKAENEMYTKGFDEKTGKISSELKSALPTETSAYISAKEAVDAFEEDGIYHLDNTAKDAIAKYQGQLKEDKSNQAEIDNLIAQAKRASEGRYQEKVAAMNSAASTLNSKINEKVAANDAVIATKERELGKAKKELFEAQQSQDHNLFDKADGSTKTRMTDDNFKQNFYDENGNLKAQLTDDDKKKVNKGAIQAAANHLTNAKTEADRKRYAKEYVTLYDIWSKSGDSEYKGKGCLEQVYDLAKKYQ